MPSFILATDAFRDSAAGPAVMALGISSRIRAWVQQLAQSRSVLRETDLATVLHIKNPKTFDITVF